MVVSLLKGLPLSRFETWVACHGDGSMIGEYRRYAAGVRSFALTQPWDVGALVELARYMRHLRCHVVHTHLFGADVLGGLAATLVRVPVRVSTIHGTYWLADAEPGTRPVRRDLMSRGYRTVYGLFDRVVAVAERVAEDLVERPGVAVRSDKITVIRNGLEDARSLPASLSVQADREGLGLPSGGAAIVTVANFFATKGHRVLLEAIPHVLIEHPSATFVLVGDGPLFAEIRRSVEGSRFAGRVRFVGGDPAPQRFLALADVIVLPSLSEGLPLVLLEALGFGKPVVATSVGGVPEVIEHGRNGLLVPPGEAVALAGAINEVLARPSLAHALGSAGHRTVLSDFSAEAMVRSTERLYLDIARARGLPVGT